MKKLFTLLSYTLVVIALVGNCDALAQKKMKKEPIMWPAADMKWTDVTMPGAPPGIQIATLWGNPEKSAYGAIVKIPAGMNDPLHTHSNDTKCVVISGTFWLAGENGEKKSFGPGSYFMVPAGWKHTSGTEGETMMFQEGPGKFDNKLVEMKKDEMRKK